MRVNIFITIKQTQLHLVIIDEKKYWEKIIQEKLNIKQTHNKRMQGLLFAKENRVVTLSRLLRNRKSLMSAWVAKFALLEKYIREH